jgi:hypothetical protein
LSHLPGLAQWAGLALIVLGGWLYSIPTGIAATGTALLLVGLANDETPQ